jgi:pimeloyl-ACP methyl ester carboxylesterase
VTVFLHAGVTDRRSWDQVVRELPLSLTAVTYDRRGFGETPVSGAPFSHLDDLLAVLDAVADGPAWLVGSSMGGGLALDVALTAPERVAGLVLIAPAVSGDETFELDLDTSRFEPLLDEAIEARNLEEINRLETWLWLDGPAQPEGRVGDPVRSLVIEMNEIILHNDAPEEAGASDVDAWGRIGEVHAPTTVLCGQLDVPFLVRRSRELAQRLPTGRFIELSGMAHLPHMENPALVARLVREACLGVG